MQVEWEESLALGVDELDDQHKELFSRFNELIKACDVGNGRNEAVRMMAFLSTYAASHFAAEEKLLQAYGYPDYEQHHGEHLSFIRELTNLQQQFQKFGPIPRLVATTNQIVAVWLIDHISRLDADFARFLAIARK